MSSVPLLVVGLGNPGTRHAGNRHNIGAMAVDAVVARHDFAPYRRRFQGDAAEGTIAGHKVLALKPTTFMNDSGRAVGEAVRFYRLDPADVLVMHDELDLAAGKIRVKSGGGHAGHNGLRSIHAHIGDDYRRLRLGIGRPESKDEVLHYVLADFAKADHAWLDPLLSAIADHFPLLVLGDDAAFMSRVALTIGEAAGLPARGGPSAEPAAD
jgi:PTH1 family peptidyl-tRNA hydrolase